MSMLSRLVALSLLAALQGCSSFSTWVAKSLEPPQLRSQPGINNYWHHRLPFGQALSLSTWRVGVGGQDASTVTIGGALSIGSVQIFLGSRPANAELVNGRLDTPGESCLSIKAQLEQASAHLGPLMNYWYANRPLPTIFMELVPPHQSSAGSRISAGKPDSTRLYMARQIFESTDCVWTRHWVAEALSTAVHELLHFDSNINMNRGRDHLRDEYVAYTMEECVFRQLLGENERVTRFPGAEDFRRAQIIDFVKKGKMPATAGGRILAYRDWQNVDIPSREETCMHLTRNYPNPRELSSHGH